MSDATRPCPICAEDIRAEAFKCKHCGSFVAMPDWRLTALPWDSLSEHERGETWNRLSEVQKIQFLAVLDASRSKRAHLQFGRGRLWWIFVIAGGIVIAWIVLDMLIG